MKVKIKVQVLLQKIKIVKLLVYLLKITKTHLPDDITRKRPSVYNMRCHFLW